jgi:hypothetical protein
MWSTALTLAVLAAATPPPGARVAVLVDDAAPSEPARAAIESALQAAGFEVISRDLALEIRRVVTPEAILQGRLPENLSVLEADAIVAGAAAYGEPMAIEGVQSLQVALSSRILDLSTGRISATEQVSGVGVGVPGPNLAVKGAQQAVAVLFKRAPWGEALAALGPQSGAVTLIVQGLPTRQALGDLRTGLEKALAGAPARELYFAQGLGKLMLGGSSARSLDGRDVADLLTQERALGLEVLEVANTRIVAKYAPGRGVSMTALVLEPKVSSGSRGEREELGRYVAGELGKFGFLSVQYQPSKLSRAQALGRAKKLRAQLLVESEILESDGALALAIRVVDVATGKPVLREQMPLAKGHSRFAAAEALLSAVQSKLPVELAQRAKLPGTVTEPAVAGAK